MKRNLQTLGLVVAAAFTLTAAVASAAEFHSAVHPQTVTGTQTVAHVLTTTSGTVTCKTVTFEGTTSASTATTQTMTPYYDNCTAFGFIGVPIHENGCTYLFDALGTNEIRCPSGKSIEITTPGCTTTIGSQHNNAGSHVITSTGSDYTITTHINDVEYRECGGTLQTGGTYRGTTTNSGTSGSISKT